MVCDKLLEIKLNHTTSTIASVVLLVQRMSNGLNETFGVHHRR